MGPSSAVLSTSSPRSIFTEGGKVQAGGGLYIERAADAELLHHCRRGNIAYILHTRQVGKSSLIGNVSGKLGKLGIASVMIDLTMFGVQVTPEQWYLGLLEEVADQLAIDTDVVEWWDERAHLPMTLRCRRFFSDVVVKECEQQVVVFLDEIDTTISLDFTDDFFAAIRELYHARNVEADLERLSFVIAGSASPNDLMSDPSRTPFNIGVRVELTDFTLDEAMPLATQFADSPQAARGLLSQVLHWTGGHPYLTQSVCKAIATSDIPVTTLEHVDEVVRRRFLTTDGDQDRNLRFVSDMLTNRADRVGRGAVLRVYRDILRGRMVSDEGQSAVVTHLRLAGIITARESRLVVRNELYRRVFDEQWVRRHLPFDAGRVVLDAFTKAIPALVALGIATPVALVAVDKTTEAMAARGAARRASVELGARATMLREEIGRLDKRRGELSEQVAHQRRLLDRVHEQQKQVEPKALARAREALVFEDKVKALATSLTAGRFEDPKMPRGGWPAACTELKRVAENRAEVIDGVGKELLELSSGNGTGKRKR